MKEPSQKKILVVAESIDVEDSSGSKANVALILNLRDAGYDVLVYHYTRKEIQLPDVKCIAIKEKKFNPLFLLSRIQRKIQHGLRLNLAKNLEPIFGFSFTFFNDANSIADAITRVEKFEPNLVLTLSKGTSFRPHYALLKVPQLHDRWMSYIHDPYPFHFYPEPYTWSEPGFEQRIAFFKEVSKNCRWAAFPSLLLKDWMVDHYPGFKDKSLVIPHQMRQQNSEGVELPPYFESNKFTLLHAGNLMKQRPPFDLIKAYKKFLEKNPGASKDSLLLLIGNASYHQSRLADIEKKISQLVVKTKSISFKKVQEMQRRASVNIILESIAEQSPFLPGKFPHCVAANKVILHLGPKRSEVRRLMGKKYRYWAEADDVNEITSIFENLYYQWKENKETVLLNRPDLEEYLSANYLREQLENLS